MNAAPVPDFDAAVLGKALPRAAERALQQASAARGTADAEFAALMRAQAAAPEHPAVLIAFYRYHFYGHRWHAARAVARRALVAGAQALGLPALWRNAPQRALPGARHDPSTRFYLFALKGLAYLSLRLGDRDEARDVLALLRLLDPDDRVGAALLEGVRLRAERRGWDGFDDDGEEVQDGDSAPHSSLTGAHATGRAAWAATARAG